MKLFINLACVLFFTSTLTPTLYAAEPEAPASLECPLGKNEESLSLARVMRNLGRFTLKADSAASNGFRDLATVTDGELTLAIEDLNLAQACAKAVINQPANEDLWPSNAHNLTGTEQEEYLQKFFKFMSDFDKGLAEYQQMFVELLSQTPEQRNFSTVFTKREELTALVDEAHFLL